LRPLGRARYQDGQKYTAQILALFERFSVNAVFPMHAQAGAPRYMEFQKAFRVKIPGLAVRVPVKMGERFVYEGWAIRN